MPDNIEYFKSIKGNLSEDQARVELYKFYRSNLRYACYSLMGFKLFPVQEIALKMMFKKDFVLGICTRGFSKTTLGGIFAALYAIFEPGNNILLVGPSFKQSKFLFDHLEKLANSPGGFFFKECFSGYPLHKNDEWSVKIGLKGMESEIRSIPLGLGDKIRGYRANVLITDELGSIPSDIMKEVLKPFLIVNKDPYETARTVEREGKLIAMGKMTEAQRTKIRPPKIIGLSSATYKFEDLSKTFDAYIKAILDPSEKYNNEATYGVFQIAWSAVPEGYFAKGFLENNRKEMSESQFKREFGAQFTDDSSGYYRMAQMIDCTVKVGESPTILLRGFKDKGYILAIDPNYKENETSDHFAMCVMELDEVTKRGYVVHNYAVAGLTLKDHIRYLHYILTNFNIVYIIIDGMGADQVISFANDNDLFRASKIELKPFESNYDNGDEIRAAKRTYNKANWAIVHKQNFSSDWIANANQWLQGGFQHKRIWFGANLMNTDYEKAASAAIPIEDLEFDSDKPKYEGLDSEKRRAKMIDLIEMQSRLIQLTKDECALIEVDITPLGTQTFRLPQNLRRATGSKRPRKDSYTALLLANHGFKCWHMLLETPENNSNTFTPFIVG